MNASIKLENIQYSHPGSDKTLFTDLNVAFDKGKMGLIGPNGCGKTTLFFLMVGLVKAPQGHILFDDKRIENKEDLVALRQSIGFLFQNSEDQLFSPTVLEDVAFGPLNLGKSHDEARDIAVTTLNALGLAGFEERITHRLSGGEKKLVALATILAMKPRLLLLDEPTNNLDPATRDHLIEILHDLPQSQIIISHDLEFLSQTTDMLYCIEDGTITSSPREHLHVHRHIHAGGDHHHHHE